MDSLVKAIKIVDCNIHDNIEFLKDKDRGLLAQNILAQSRNLLEYINQRIYSADKGINSVPYDYYNKKDAKDYVNSKKEFKCIKDLHKKLQSSISHYTNGVESSIILLTKNIDLYVEVRDLYMKKFNESILDNILDFLVVEDKVLVNYYDCISNNIAHRTDLSKSFKSKYYVTKVEPFKSNNKLYYQLTLIAAYDNTSKFNKIIAYSDTKIMTNYALDLYIHKDKVTLFNNEVEIFVIDNWKVAIRGCEFKNFSKIFDDEYNKKYPTLDCKYLMNIMTDYHVNLVDIVTLSDEKYNVFKSKCTVKENSFFNYLDKARNIIKANSAGSNILRCLLFNMNNVVIKRQLIDRPNNFLSYLRLSNGCIQFDRMPYCRDLINHKVNNYTLDCCLEQEPRDFELFVNKINSNAEDNNVLFTDKSDLVGFDDCDKLATEYFQIMYKKDKPYKQIVSLYNKYYYVKQYYDITLNIINKLKELSNISMEEELLRKVNSVDSEFFSNLDEEKKTIIKNMFLNSSVALIYGDAGTGKTKLIEALSQIFNSSERLYLSNNNSAVDHLRATVGVSNHATFLTIKKALSEVTNCNFDFIFVDECTMVSNEDMNSILVNCKYKFLVLVGDKSQIESIKFGNWFNVSERFINVSAVNQLEKTYRSKNVALLKLWHSVKELDPDIYEILIAGDMTEGLSESLLEKYSEDEINLCLNYDGVYGINNLNKILQSKNDGKEVSWREYVFKVNDPILFNDSNRFKSGCIYNNLKGRIIDVIENEEEITFRVEVDTYIGPLDVFNDEFNLIEADLKSNKSIIEFELSKSVDSDNDYISDRDVLPIQVAYAISIHKAQGLEFDSVKIIINEDSGDKITHDVFYTAITRAKNKLKIYWDDEVATRVIKGLSKNNYDRDVSLISKISGLKINKKSK